MPLLLRSNIWAWSGSICSIRRQVQSWRSRDSWSADFPIFAKVVLFWYQCNSIHPGRRLALRCTRSLHVESFLALLRIKNRLLQILHIVGIAQTSWHIGSHMPLSVAMICVQSYGLKHLGGQVPWRWSEIAAPWDHLAQVDPWCNAPDFQNKAKLKFSWISFFSLQRNLEKILAAKSDDNESSIFENSRAHYRYVAKQIIDHQSVPFYRKPHVYYNITAWESSICSIKGISTTLSRETLELDAALLLHIATQVQHLKSLLNGVRTTDGLVSKQSYTSIQLK